MNIIKHNTLIFTLFLFLFVNAFPCTSMAKDEEQSFKEVLQQIEGTGNQTAIKKHKAQNNIVYKENFESEPSYKIFSSSDGSKSIIKHDSSNSNYYVKIHTDSSNTWWEGALSPKFKDITKKQSFIVEFDFNPVKYGFGLYPEVAGVHVLGDNPKSDWNSVWKFVNQDSASKSEKLRFIGRNKENSNVQFLKDTPDYNSWYHVKIAYNADTETGSLKVTDSNENMVIKKEEFSWQLPHSFNHIWIGDIQGEDDWNGDDASVRVDNIKLMLN